MRLTRKLGILAALVLALGVVAPATPAYANHGDPVIVTDDNGTPCSSLPAGHCEVVATGEGIDLIVNENVVLTCNNEITIEVETDGTTRVTAVDITPGQTGCGSAVQACDLAWPNHIEWVGSSPGAPVDQIDLCLTAPTAIESDGEITGTLDVTITGTGGDPLTATGATTNGPELINGPNDNDVAIDGAWSLSGDVLVICLDAAAPSGVCDN